MNIYKRKILFRKDETLRYETALCAYETWLSPLRKLFFNSYAFFNDNDNDFNVNGNVNLNLF